MEEAWSPIRGRAPSWLGPLVGAGLATLAAIVLFAGPGIEPSGRESSDVVTVLPRASQGAPTRTAVRPVESSGVLLARATTFELAAGGLTIISTSDADLLTASRLKIGDVVVQSDGTTLGANAEPILRGHWASLDSVETTVLRDGRLRRLTIALR